MKKLYLFLKKAAGLFILLFTILFSGKSFSQSACLPTCSAVTSFTANLSSNPNNTYTVSSVRNGQCCFGSGSDACVVFYVTVHPSATEIKFFKSGGNNGNYQINCGGTMYNPTAPVCLNGLTQFCLTYCNPGNNNDTYTITTSSGFSATPNFSLRAGCSGTMSVSGLNPNSITWTSITGSVQGLYNSYLSCTSGSNCITPVVTPTASTPSFIDYKVCGTKAGCSSGTVCDTVRVFTTPGLSVSITPTNPIVCSGGSSTIALTASVSGGAPPYTYTWSSGANTSTIGAAVGNYTLNVNDATSGCAAFTSTIAVGSAPTPTTPSISSNSPLCAGQTLNLTTPLTGGTYTWTGPNGFTSNLQNPSISAITLAGSGTYSVSTTVGGCTSSPGTLAVTVNPAPITPTATANSPLCALQTLSLTATNIAGATYSWSGPNGFTSTSQNPTIPNISTAGAGTYSVFATAAGCPGGTGTIAVTVNPAPATPTAGANTPLCSGQTLSLTSSTIASATYNWTGPNGFTSTLQNPTLANATTAAGGTYSVSVTVAGCPGAAGTVAVVVNPTPIAPTAGGNTPLCAGQTLNLTATSTGATYNWSGPNAFSSTTQNPSITGITTAGSGIYSVTTTSLGCTSPQGTVSITVNPTPLAPVAGSNGPLCAGATLNLTASSTGVTYSWTGPNGFTSTTQNPSLSNVTTAATGIYSVTATASGCTSAAGTISVTVNPIPVTPTASNNSTLCAGQTLNLTVTPNGATSYSWTGPNGFTSTTQNPSIAGVTTAASGVYSVTQVVNGCTSLAGTTTATINPIPATPTPGSNGPICAGQALNLTALPNGLTYSWTGPNGFTSTSQNPTIAAATTAASGTYSLTVNSLGCNSPAGTLAVVVNPTPAPPTAGGTNTVCAGGNINLTSTNPGGATWSWTGPNGFTSTSQNPSIAGASTLATGMYSVTVTVAGCTSLPGTHSVSVFGNPAAPTLGANSPVCTGQTLSLTASSILGASYSWTGPNGFTSSLQNPTIAGVTAAAAGNYTVAVNVSGCGSSGTVIAVTVNSTPATPVAGSNGPLCVGATLNLTSSSTGATYSWTGPNGFTSTTQNPSLSNVTTAATGIYSVTATASGCTSAAGTISVTVNPIPVTPTASNNSTLCAGQTLNLTVTPNGATSYSWTGPNGFTSTTQNPSIAGVTTAASGVYSVTQVVNGCTSLAGTTTATINPIPATPTPGSNGPICAGQALNLTALPNGLTYSWTGPNGFTSTSQNPTIAAATTAASGTYSLTVNSLGCNSPAGTLAVVVNPTPAPPTAGGTNTVCAGGNINLTSTNPGGATWGWTGPNGFTSTSQNPSIAGASTLATGMYSVTVTVAGCTSLPGTHSVSVFGNPAAPTLGANSPVCTGQTLSLTASSILGASYSWTGPNGFTSSLQNPTIAGVTAAAAGNYTVAVNVSGCGSSGTVIAVTVNSTPATPVAGSNGPLCAGATLNLTASSTGATYSWTGPNGFTSTTQNPSLSNVTTAATGIYSVTATASGCTSAAGTISVTVNPIPVTPTASNNSTLCAGQTLNLTVTPNGATSYSWTGPNGFTSTTQNPSIAGVTTAASGVYSVTQVVNGCTSLAGTTTATINPIPATPTPGSNGPICAGQALNLTALPNGLTYSWTGPNGFTSTSQNPTIAAATTAASGTYSLTVNSLGCNSPAGTLAVVVNPTPAPPTAGGTNTVCAGGNINLTSTNPGGATWGWTGPNGFTSTSQNPSIAGASTLATGMYSVTVTVAGCTSLPGTHSVSVFGNPAAPTLGANSPVCTGQTLSLTASSILGASYSWTGPNGFTSSLQNPTIAGVTAAAAGNYTVAVNVSGCGSSGTVIAVTVNSTPATPVAGSNGPLCVGATLNLTSSSTGATYSWTGPNGFTSTTQNPSLSNVTTAATGIYSVTATSAAGCTGSAGTISVTVNPIPAAPTASNNSAICAGQTLSLTASPSGASSYNWSGPNGFTSTSQNPTIAGVTTLANGTYTVSQTVLGCVSPDGITTVTVNPIPSAPSASYNGPICAGQALNFTGLPNGLTYNWTGPNGFTSTSQNPTITAATTAAGGTYSLTVNSLGCNSPAGTLAVVVNPTPAAPTTGGTATLCTGGTINLTSTNPGGATFSWTGPNSFTASTQNTSITNASTLATGMYSVTATVNGCTSLPGTFSVSVFGNPSAPTLTATTPACTGQPLNLGAATILGASYSWTGPNGFTSAVQNPTISSITLAGAGTYSLAVNVSGCGSSAATIAVIVNPTPASPTAVNNSAICDGSTLSFTANPGGGIYNWTGPNSFTSTSQNPSITGASTLATGMYSVTITVNGCTSAAGTTSATVNPIPAAPTATANGTWCAGQTVSLSANPGGAIYSWTGPNGFTSTLQNPTITNASTSASGTYSVTQTLLGCTSPEGIVSITVSPIPSAPVVGSNAPICALQTLSLTAGSGATSYSWTGPNSFTSTAQNPTISPVTVAASGNYSVTQTILGCTSPVAITNVTINPAAPTPTATSNSPICLNQTLNLTQTSITGATYSWSGPNGFTSSSQNPSIANTQTIATGVYSVFATVAGCPGQTSTISVLVSQPGTVTPASSPTVCANNSTISLSGVSSTGSGTWTSSGTGIFSPNTINGTYLPSASDISAGNITFTLTSTNNGGCAAATNTMEAFITPAPTASAGTNATVCANNATVSLSGSVTIASGGTWSTTGTGTFVPNNTALTASYVPSAADIAAGSFTLTLTTSGNGNCFAVSNSKVITISPAPVVNPGLNPQFVCTNNPNYQLNGTSSTGSASWFSSGTGTFSNPNILNPVYFSSPADTVAGSITLTLTSTNNGGCFAVSQTVTLIYTSTLSVNAGNSQIVCANSNISLNGVSTTSAGVWTSSGSGSFSPSASSLTTSYVPSAADILAGGVTLTLTSSNNGGCNPVTSVMNVTITPGPTASAGSNQTVCANNATVALTGTFSVASGVSWSSSGTGTFSPNNTSPNVNYFASASDTTAGFVTISLTTTGNGSCSATTSTMNINFTPAPLVNAGGTVSVCKNNPVVILNGYSSTGTGTWTTMGTGTLSSNSVLNPTYTPSTADTTAGSINIILTSTGNGGCNSVDDTVTVVFSAPPTVTAGLTQTVCANNSTVTLNGTSSTGSGTWTTSGDGSFSPNSINGSYVPGSADISAGVVTLTLTTTNNGGCNSVFNTTTVNISPAPVALAGTDQTVCANSGTVNLAGSFSISTGATWSTTGTGTFTPDNFTMNTGYIPSTADTAAGSVTIFLTTSGNGNCLQVTDTVVINFIRSPFVSAGSDINLCPNSPNPVLGGISTAGTASWSTMGSGSFSPNNTVLNPTYIPSSADQSAGSVTLVLTSGTVTCGSGADTVVINFKPQPSAAFTYTNRCLGTATSFTNAATTPSGSIVSWLWYFNTDTSTTKDPSYTFTGSGTQTVSLVVSNGSCTDSINRTIYINPLPSSMFTHTVLCHDSVQFVNTATVSPGGISNWNWDFGDTQTLTAQDPYHVYADTGFYVVSLTVQSDSGCVGSFNDSVHVTKCMNDIVTIIGEPAVPSGFTPNGDGSNDVLYVKGGPYNSLDFRIFNEWGNQIFHADIQSSGWDGTFKSAPQPVGRFIWTLNGELIDGRKVKMAGEVILNR